MNQPVAAPPPDEHEKSRFLTYLATTFYPKSDAPLDDEQLRRLARKEPPAQAFDLDLLRGLARRWRGASPDHVAPLTEQGTFHRLFRLTWGAESAILRLQLPQSYPDLPDPRVLLEHRLNQRLIQAGVPAVPILHADNSRADAPWDWQILAPAVGRPLSQLEGDEPALRAALAALGKVMARLHRALPVEGAGWIDPFDDPSPPRPLKGIRDAWPDYLGARLHDHLRRLLDDGLLSPEEADRVQRRLADFHHRPPAPALLHGDPGNHNFFQRDGEISAILDWEDALIGDPWHDVAFWATFHPERRWDAFLQGYLDGAPWNPDDQARFHLYHLRITLAKIVHRQRFGYPDPPGRPTGRQRLLDSLHRLEAV